MFLYIISIISKKELEAIPFISLQWFVLTTASTWWDLESTLARSMSEFLERTN